MSKPTPGGSFPAPHTAPRQRHIAPSKRASTGTRHDQPISAIGHELVDAVKQTKIADHAAEHVAMGKPVVLGRPHTKKPSLVSAIKVQTVGPASDPLSERARPQPASEMPLEQLLDRPDLLRRPSDEIHRPAARTHQIPKRQRRQDARASRPSFHRQHRAACAVRNDLANRDPLVRRQPRRPRPHVRPAESGQRLHEQNRIGPQTPPRNGRLSHAPPPARVRQTHQAHRPSAAPPPRRETHAWLETGPQCVVLQCASKRRRRRAPADPAASPPT